MERFTFRTPDGPLKAVAKAFGLVDGMPFGLRDDGVELAEWAAALGLDLRRYLDGREIAAAPAMTYEPVVNRYLLTVCSASRSPKTWVAAAQHLATFFTFLEARGVDWRAVTKTHLVEYHRLRVLSPPDGQAPLKESSWNACIGAVSRFYTWAVEEKLLDESPIRKRTRRYLDRVVERNELTEHVPAEPIRFISLAQYREFRQALAGGADGRGRNGVRNVAFADTLLCTGIRVSEACGLKVSLLPDPQAARYRGLKTLPLSVVGKGRKRRQVQLSRAAREEIEVYVADERAAADERARRKGRAADTDSLWLTERGAPMTPPRWEEIFARASASTGIKCTPHFLRHSFAVYTLSALLRVTIGSVSKLQGRERQYAQVIQNPLRQLQHLLGHSSVASTYVYLDLIEEHSAMVDEAIDQWTQDAFVGGEEA